MNEVELLRNSLNISVWMLCVTVFLAVSTVTISAINMGFQRSHNRKSVKPFCNVHSLINETGIGINIMNAGLGPMIIEKIVLLKNPDDAPEHEIQFAEILPGEFQYDTVINKNDSYIIPSMGEMKLFHYTGDLKDKKNRVELLKSTLENYYICLIFRDIYDHRYKKSELLKF